MATSLRDRSSITACSQCFSSFKLSSKVITRLFERFKMHEFGFVCIIYLYNLAQS